MLPIGFIGETPTECPAAHLYAELIQYPNPIGFAPRDRPSGSVVAVRQQIIALRSPQFRISFLQQLDPLLRVIGSQFVGSIHQLRYRVVVAVRPIQNIAELRHDILHRSRPKRFELFEVVDDFWR